MSPLERHEKDGYLNEGSRVKDEDKNTENSTDMTCREERKHKRTFKVD